MAKVKAKVSTPTKKVDKGVVILRRKSKGLAGIQGVQGTVQEFGLKGNNKEGKGSPLGEFKERGFPGTRRGLCLFWNDYKDQYCWGGNPQILQEIVTKKRLRYEKGHPNEGQIIEYADIRDMSDPFFSHTYFDGLMWMEGGRKTFNLNILDDELFYYSYKGNPDVHDRTQDQNEVFVKGAKYELVHPKQNIREKQKDYKSVADATIALAGMSFEKKTYIAEIMDIMSYNLKDPDPDALFVSLTEEAISGNEPVARYNKRTGLERFTELMALSDADLMVMAQVIRGKKLGILRNRGKYWQLNTGTSDLNDRIETGNTDADIINFFRNENNTDYYVELAHQLEQRALK